MKIKVTVLFIILSQLVWGQGIQFQAKNWSEAVALAKNENKIIFLDAYTTWCAPCKVMEEYVFTHELGGDLYNANFINLRMDMEKEMGPLLASRYGVTSYPTFLFLTWDGTLVYKSVGYQNIEKLVGEGRKALEPYRLERALTDRYKGGDRIPDFLYHLTYYRLGKNDPSYRELIPMYLETQTDWLQADNIRYIFKFVDDFDSDMFKHMAENKLEYGELVGVDQFNDKFKMFIQKAMDNNGEPLTLERREEIYKVAYPNFADQMITEYKLDYYTDNGDQKNYASTAYYYYTTYAGDEVDAIAKHIPLFEQYLTSKEEKAYIRNWYEEEARKKESATGWLKIAQFNLDEGNFSKATELGKKAKKLAKASKEDQKPYKTFLKQVKKTAKARK